MSKFKDVAKGILTSMGPRPNPFMEQAKELADDLDPAVKAQVLAQLAIAQEINELRDAVKSLSSSIYSKS